MSKAESYPKFTTITDTDADKAVLESLKVMAGENKALKEELESYKVAALKAVHNKEILKEYCVKDSEKMQKTALKSAQEIKTL